MSGSSLDASSALRTIVFAMDVPDEVLGQFRAEFPHVRFVVPGEDAGPDERAMLRAIPPSGDDLRDADGLIGWRVTAEELAAAPNVRWLHASGAGVERYPLAEIAARGIMMTNASGVSAPNMAEHVLGMMLALARRLPTLIQAQARHAWRDSKTHDEVSELQGQTMLIVGMGDIGQEVAKRAAAFDVRILGLRRRRDLPPPLGCEVVFGIDDLPQALSAADHVVVTLPHTPESRGLFDEAVFASMKPGAIIYNVGRGPVIDTAALIAALESGHLGGAGLDVTDPEPLPGDSPLWDMDNVLITAHTSGATPRYWDRQEALIAEIIRHIQRGDPPPNLVDFQAGY